MDAPELELFCRLEVDLAPIREMGIGRAGQRRIIPIVGGRASGPYLTGHILNLGADWQTIFQDGVAELDTRYAIETDQGHTIEVKNFGYRHCAPDVIAALARGEQVDPTQYYMRTHAILETGDPDLAWINRTLFVGTGARLADQVIITLFALR